MKKRMSPLLFMLFILVVFQGTASANAGTALMWATAFHLLIGNLIIGIFEGLVIGFIFRQYKWRSISLMIVANYVSAWATVLILDIFEPLRESITIYQIKPFFIIAMISVFIFTVFAEWPFVHFSFHRHKRKLYLTLMASLLIHILSYSGLIYYYFGASGKGLLKNAQIVPLSEIETDIHADIYYIDNSKAICKISLDGYSTESYEMLEQDRKIEGLYFQKSGTCYDLYASMCGPTEAWKQTDELIREQVLCDIDIRLGDNDPNQEYWGWGYDPVDYRPIDKREWEIYAGFWATSGLTLYNETTEERFHVSLETPFAVWYVRHPTILNDNIVVFTMGKQICVYDRSSRKLALLAKGTCPAVALKSGSGN